MKLIGSYVGKLRFSVTSMLMGACKNTVGMSKRRNTRQLSSYCSRSDDNGHKGSRKMTAGRGLFTDVKLRLGTPEKFSRIPKEVYAKMPKRAEIILYYNVFSK